MLSRAKSDELFAEALKWIPGGVNSPGRAFRAVGGHPFFAQRASGAHVYDVDDNDYIDYVGTWGPAIHGHAFPPIIDAIKKVAEHGTSFGIPNPLEVAMAKLITESVPSVKKVRMCNSGTEATMSAIRLARGFTKRDKIIKFSGCYHGHSDSLLIKAGSGALTHGNPDSAGVPASFANETVVLPYNDRAALEAAFAANPGQIACVIIEAYCGNVGFIMPDAGYLRYLREITTGHGALLIFDEVMTGFRIAKGGVQEREKIVPDLTCLGKIIGGGLPVGAFGGRAAIMDLLAPLGPVYQAGTLSGNPLAMAAGIAGLKLLDELNPYARLDVLGRQLRDAVLGACRTKGLAVQVPQCGSMFSIFFTDTPVRDYATALQGDAKLFGRFFQACLDRGVYLAPSAYEAGFLSTAHDGPAISRACDVLAESIRAL